METKLFEVRDRMTMIPVMATKLIPARSEAERFLLGWAGYHSNAGQFDGWIVLVHLSSAECQNDPYEWTGGSRTMHEAHKYIQQHWDELQSGEVVDVEYILGETTVKKESDAKEVRL